MLDNSIILYYIWCQVQWREPPKLHALEPWSISVCIYAKAFKALCWWIGGQVRRDWSSCNGTRRPLYLAKIAGANSQANQSIVAGSDPVSVLTTAVESCKKWVRKTEVSWQPATSVNETTLNQLGVVRNVGSHWPATSDLALLLFKATCERDGKSAKPQAAGFKLQAWQLLTIGL